MEVLLCFSTLKKAYDEVFEYLKVNYPGYQCDIVANPNNYKKIANIISWNIWQMDGLTCTVPYSCHNTKVQIKQTSLFDDEVTECKPCPGCEKNDMFSHNGLYCKIKDWRDNSPLLYVSMIQRRSNK